MAATGRRPGSARRYQAVRASTNSPQPTTSRWPRRPRCGPGPRITTPIVGRATDPARGPPPGSHLTTLGVVGLEQRQGRNSLLNERRLAVSTGTGWSPCDQVDSLPTGPPMTAPSNRSRAWAERSRPSRCRRPRRASSTARSTRPPPRGSRRGDEVVSVAVPLQGDEERRAEGARLSIVAPSTTGRGADIQPRSPGHLVHGRCPPVAVSRVTTGDDRARRASSSCSAGSRPSTTCLCDDQARGARPARQTSSGRHHPGRQWVQAETRPPSAGAAGRPWRRRGAIDHETAIVPTAGDVGVPLLRPDGRGRHRSGVAEQAGVPYSRGSSGPPWPWTRRWPGRFGGQGHTAGSMAGYRSRSHCPSRRGDRTGLGLPCFVKPANLAPSVSPGP
jgi:hypothetical protein